MKHSKWLLGTLCLLLSACSQGSSSASGEAMESIVEQSGAQNEAFEELCEQIFVDHFENSYMSIHTSFVDPKAYGLSLEDASVTLGYLLPDEQEVQKAQEIYDQLRDFDADKLSSRNALILNELLFQYENQIELSKPEYNYLDQIWINGQSFAYLLQSFFNSYELYQIEDIPYLLEYFSQMDDLVEEAREYTAIQAEKGYLQMEGNDVMDFITALLEEKANQPVLKRFEEKIQSLDASQEQKQEAIDQVAQALEEHYYPGFEQMRQIVEEYQPQAKPVTGLAGLENGQEYYSWMLRSQAATSLDPEQVEDRILGIYQDRIGTLFEFYQKGVDPEKWETLTDSFETIDDILAFIKENYEKSFPEIESFQMEVQPMSELEAMDSSVLAYMIPQPFDSDYPYPVFYNANYAQFDSLDFYITLSHESVPGHIYEQQYRKQHTQSNIEYALDTLAFQEGWATYASVLALGWIDGLSAEEKASYVLMENLNQLIIMMLDLEINYYGTSLEDLEEEFGIDKELYVYLAQNPTLFFSYYFGSQVMQDWYKDAQEELGSKFDPVEFNEVILENMNLHFDLIKKEVYDYIGKQGGQA